MARAHLIGNHHNRKHGLFGTPICEVWSGMIQRCCNPRSPHYRNYGGRGITVCDRWRKSFEAFNDDMGPRPAGKYSLGRIDNDGPYCPKNCRWETDAQQRGNMRTSRKITWNGETHTLAEWQRIRGMTPKVLAWRLKVGWSLDRAFTTPIRHHARLPNRPNG